MAMSGHEFAPTRAARWIGWSRAAAPWAAAILLAGALAAWRDVHLARAGWERAMGATASECRDALNHERIQELAATDPDTGVVHRVRRQLEGLGALVEGFRSFGILAADSSGRWRRVLVAGLPEASMLEGAAAGKGEMGRPILRVPARDGAPARVVATMAVRDPKSGGLVGAIELSRVEDGAGRLSGAVLPTSIAVAFLLAIAAWSTFPGASDRRETSVLRLPAVLLGAGTILSVWLGWNVRLHESEDRSALFDELAGHEIDHVVGRIRTIRETELESLVRFFVGSVDVTRGEFAGFCGFLERNRSVDSWWWVDRVDSTRRRAYEAKWRRAFGGGGLWDRDASGRSTPAPGRREHMAIWGAWPVRGRDPAGRDLASDPILLRAFAEASATGMPSSSGPFPVETDSVIERGVAFVRPVASRGAAGPRGFAVAVLRPRILLRDLDDLASLDLALGLLDSAGRIDTLATTAARAETDPSLRRRSAFFAFGRVFVVDATPTEEFLELHDLAVGGYVGGLGLLVSLAAAASTLLALRRRRDLERMVRDRSVELRRQEDSYRAQFAENNAPMLLIDPEDRRIVEANEAATRFYGWTRDELLRMRTADLDDRRDEDGRRIAPTPGGTLAECRHRTAGGEVRDVEISVSIVQMGARPLLHAIVHDATARRAAERSRRELEERLEWALEAAGDGVWDWNLATGVVAHNRRWCRILGLDDSFLEHSPDMFVERLHPEDGPRVLERIRNCLEGGGSYASLHRLRHADGGWRWLEDRGDVVQRGEDGSPLRLVGSMSDITSRKEAEDELREAEARRRLAMELAGLAHWEYSFATRTFLFNEQYYAMHRTSFEREGAWSVPLDAWLARFVTPESIPDISGHLRTAVESTEPGFTCQFEHDARMADGEIRTVSVRLTVEKDAAGRPMRAFGATQDVTERRRAERALTESEAKLRLALDIARIASWEFDVAAGAFLLDDQYFALHGTDSVQEGGCAVDGDDYLRRFVHPQDAPRLARMIEDVRAEGLDGNESVQFRGIRRDGAPLHLAARWITVFGDDGRPARCIGATQDVTERRRAELELVEMNRSLERANDAARSLAREAEMASVAKSEFLANMSHEIRTPLNGVIGMTGLLLGSPLDERQRHCVDVAHRSGEALLGLLNDILDLSKIEAGRIELETVEFDVASILDGVGAMLAPKAAEKGLELVCSAAPGTASPVRGDPARLRQIVLNLAGNAVKFTEKGEVVLRAEALSESDTGFLLRVEVRDTGIGIPADRLERLFSKFVQADASTSRRFGGSGLGLAISRQLAELMGGRLEVESVEGAGSVFRLELALERAPRGADPAPCGVCAGRRILVVDDSAAACVAISEMAASLGSAARTVPSGVEALVALRDAAEAGAPFDAVLVDQRMQGLDGPATVRAVRAATGVGSPAIALMTWLPGDPSVAARDGSGADLELSKPVNPGSLGNALRLLLDPGRVRTDSVTSAEAPSPPRATLRADARILLVEDNVVNQMVALGILEALGLRADVAGDGLEALETLRSSRYDLVLMDVQMPGLDGYETTRRIRSAGTGVLDPTIPVVAMTANAMRGDRERCLEAGMDGYVAKPVDPKELAEALRRWLADGRAAEQPAAVVAARGDSRDADPVVFDRAALLGRVFGDRELFEKLVSQFRRTMPLEVDALAHALSQAQFAEAAHRAHAVKGAAANMGAQLLAAAARRCEEACLRGDADQGRLEHRAMREAFERWAASTRRG